MKNLVSIIVPVYNAEKYLKKSIKSIISQTYKNIEIICIDDGSNDKSLEILHKFADEDQRIRIIHKKNEGVSLARNTGLENAKGDFVLFVDSDDWIEKNLCETLLFYMEKKELDVVMCSYIREKGGESQKKVIFDNDIIFLEKDVKEKLHQRMIGIRGKELAHPENADALCTVWGKLYRRKIIEDYGIRFYDIKEIGTYEDGLFNLSYFEHTKKAMFIKRYLYHYRKTNEESITHAYNPDLQLQWKRLFHIMKVYIKKNKLSRNYRQALQNRISLSLIPLGINIVSQKCPIWKKIKDIRNVLEEKSYKTSIKTLDIKYMPFHWKIFFHAAKWKNTFVVVILLNVIQLIRGK